MARSALTLIRRLDDDLDDDFRCLKLGPNNTKNIASKTSRQKFALYVLSVATHSIGLKASVSPLDSSEENMIAYVADMFGLNDKKLDKIINYNETGRVSVMKRLHSWRPAIRIKLRPPIIIDDYKLKLHNLKVRVFVFKGSPNKTNANTKSEGESDKSTWVMRRIFKSARFDASTLIRPVRDMLYQLGFEQIHSNGSDRFRPRDNISRMIIIPKDVNNNDTSKPTLVNDLRINIKRYRCDPSHNYILRFEFWFDVEQAGLSFVSRYRRFVRLLLQRGCFRHLRFDKNINSGHFDANQEFYGFINIKLSKLASYPTRQIYPILNLRERKVNKCEISLEIQNRRIEDLKPTRLSSAAATTITAKIGQDGKLDPKRPSMDYIVNHIRLYISCIIYQCIALRLKPEDFQNESQVYSNLTLDNLFFLPGHTLINQHRLQSNISRLEDLSLRRMSMIVLLMKLEQIGSITGSINANKVSNLTAIQRIVAAILQNEYLKSRQIIDERTQQHLDPFEDSPVIDSSRSLVVESELLALREFLESVLKVKIRDWLLETKSNRYAPDKLMSLVYLKLFKTAISHFKKCECSIRVMIKSKFDAMNGLQRPVEEILCEIIINYFRIRLVEIMNKHVTPGKRVNPIKAARLQGAMGNKNQRTGPWTELLNDMRYIDQDLIVHWSHKGLAGLFANQAAFVRRLGTLGKLERQNLEEIIRIRLDEYIND